MKSYHIILLFILSSCVEQIDFEPLEFTPEIVVYGKITNSKGPHQVSIMQTTDFGVQKPKILRVGAVTLHDNAANVQPFILQSDGTFKLFDFEGIVGRTYWIEIDLGGGKIIRSKAETMQPVPKAEKLTFKREDIPYVTATGSRSVRRIINGYIHTPLIETEQGLRLRWEGEGVWMFTEPPQPWDPFFAPKTCFITEKVNPQSVILFDASKTSASRVDDFLVYGRGINHTFNERQYYNVYQHSLTINAYEYWSDIAQIVNQAGTIFDVPPATIRGNIYNPSKEDEIILGFFEATSIDTVRVSIFPSDISYSPIAYCSQSFWAPSYDECGNCLLWENSTDVRPSWW